MKNKIIYKRYMILNFILVLLLIIVFSLFNFREYNSYVKNYNDKINMILTNIKEHYHEVKEVDIIKTINKKAKVNDELFYKYGFNNDSMIEENNHLFWKYLVLEVSFLTLILIVIIIIFFKYNKSQENKIDQIIKYLEELNKGNYSFKIDSMSEDELSILKDRIGKITIKLREMAEESNKDKISLKNSLEDISHQLKTPLTSLLIIVDDLLENSNMDINIRNNFLLDMKREINKISFLVLNILKLSKFDANVIEFSNEEVLLKDIIKEAIKNLSSLCDLKNITIRFNLKNNSLKVSGDKKWQIEAITNVLKNAIEHSKENGVIDISCSDGRLYKTVEIIDYGKGIDKKDINHIFERFYKGKNSSSESVGIGLALAKEIIKKNNGSITVSSDKKSTKFTIRYY